MYQRSVAAADKPTTSSLQNNNKQTITQKHFGEASYALSYADVLAAHERIQKQPHYRQTTNIN